MGAAFRKCEAERPNGHGLPQLGRMTESDSTPRLATVLLLQFPIRSFGPRAGAHGHSAIRPPRFESPHRDTQLSQSVSTIRTITPIPPPASPSEATP